MKSKILMLALCLIFSQYINAQVQRTITGRVTDSNGQPLEGVSITERETKQVVLSSAEGRFSFSTKAQKGVLIFSYTGMAEQTVSLGSSNSLNIVMKSITDNLDEVVVVGYQSINKNKITGSISKVSGESIANKPVLSFDQALAGKAAGVLINTSSGLVGDNVIIRIRGASSISSGSQPLIVMDGVPISQGNDGQLYNPANLLADLNPNDIESVEVLKDAASTAIYGSRAAAGVLLITTKKGKQGSSTVTYDNFFGIVEPSRTMKVLDGDQYTNVINTSRTNAGLGNIAAYADFNGDGTIDKVSTNWQDEVFRKGFNQSHQLSISGGANRTNYFASLAYNDFENYLMANRQTRTSARLNLTTKAKDWLEIGIKSQFSKNVSYGLGSGTGGALSGNPFGPLTAYPNVPVYNPDGTYYIGPGGNSPLNNTPNPLAVQSYNFDNRTSDRFIGSFHAELQPIKDLKIKAQYNLDYQKANSDQYWDPRVGDGAGLAGVAQTVYNENNVWSLFTTANYTKRVGNHDFNVLAGMEYTRRTGLFYYAFGLGLNDPLFRIIDPANFATVGSQNGQTDNNGLASYFGGVNYGYKNKYLATFNIRTDAYSGFGKENRFGTFPSASIAWKVTEEDFMKNFRVIKDMKLRTSYGLTGNSNIGDFPALSTFGPTQYADIASLNLTNPGNSSLRWEKSVQLDIGLDFTIGKNISFVMDYFHKKTKDLILNNPILATVGFPGNAITQNIGTIESKGFEFSVNVPVITRNDFSWNSSFNFTSVRNNVIATNDNNSDIFGGVGLARPGHPLGAFYLIRWAGVNPSNGQPTFLDVSGVQKQYNHAAPAANRWTKVSDGTVTTPITANDRVVNDNMTPYPKFFGGLTNNFTYKNFDFSVDFQYSFGFYVFNSTKQTLSGITNNRNKSTDVLNAWGKSNDQTNVPKLIWGDNIQAQNSTRFAEKGDFLRVRNIQIGYNLAKSITGKIGMSRVRIYGQIQNAFLLTGYTGIDPESNANGNNNIGQGVDTFRPYLPRIVTFGLNVGF